MKWKENSLEGEILLGGNGFGNKTYQFNSPMSLQFGQYGNLFVLDYENFRIQKFSIQI